MTQDDSRSEAGCRTGCLLAIAGSLLLWLILIALVKLLLGWRPF